MANHRVINLGGQSRDGSLGISITSGACAHQQLVRFGFCSLPSMGKRDNASLLPLLVSFSVPRSDDAESSGPVVTQRSRLLAARFIYSEI